MTDERKENKNKICVAGCLCVADCAIAYVSCFYKNQITELQIRQWGKLAYKEFMQTDCRNFFQVTEQE